MYSAVIDELIEKFERLPGIGRKSAERIAFYILERMSEDDAVNMARRLSKELGIGVGISSGANLIGCILAQKKVNKPMCTVFSDDNKKYLSTDLVKDIDLNENYISNKIKLLSWEAL